MADPALIRAVGLLGPLVLVSLLWLVKRPGYRLRAGLLLSLGWVLPVLWGWNLVAMEAGWWRFEASGGTLGGVPVDLWLGWAVLWGVGAPLSGLRWWVLLPLALWLDVGLMPWGAPVLELGERWLLGEVGALGLVLLPGLAVARLTEQDRALPLRAGIQVFGFGGIVFGLLPAILLEGSPRPVPLGGIAGGVVWQLFALTLGLGIGAVQEFASRGRGTPLPWDPPSGLVTSGLYAYVRHPMQLSVAAGLLLLALGLSSQRLLLASVAAFVFFSGLAAWHERLHLRARFGEPYRRYAAAVGAFWPRWRPWHPSEEGERSPGVLYLARGCGACESLARWFRHRRPVGLRLQWAQEHPDRDLARITYDPADGTDEQEGMAALGRGLEHLSLGWGLIGVCLRLPVVCTLFQLMGDALGPGPRRVRRDQNLTKEASQGLFRPDPDPGRGETELPFTACRPDRVS